VSVEDREFRQHPETRHLYVCQACERITANAGAHHCETNERRHYKPTATTRAHRRDADENDPEAYVEVLDTGPTAYHPLVPVNDAESMLPAWVRRDTACRSRTEDGSRLNDEPGNRAVKLLTRAEAKRRGRFPCRRCHDDIPVSPD